MRVRLRVCVCACAFTCVRVCGHVHTCVCGCVLVHECISLRLRACVCFCTRVNVHVCAFARVCLRACVCVYVHVCAFARVRLRACVCVVTCIRACVRRAYLVQTGLVEGLSAARVSTHLVWDGRLQPVRVADPTLSTQTLRREGLRHLQTRTHTPARNTPTSPENPSPAFLQNYPRAHGDTRTRRT